ncbi:MAG: hypothetical protein HYZ53_15315 [Planctomycetes bacterium]|nr:hypothetical protein [Planctomycetota bacterium]
MPIDDSDRELQDALSQVSGEAWSRAEAEAFRTLIGQTGWDLHNMSSQEWRQLVLQARPFCTELGRAQAGDEGARMRLLEWSDRTLARFGNASDAAGDN